MSSNKALRKAKHDAYEAKQEKRGKRVIRSGKIRRRDASLHRREEL